MAPERINPPNPNKPDYDIRADVWSLGITLVELATGSFPYKDCKTEFEVLTKVIQDDPPCLPVNQGFSNDFRSFVHKCLLKNHRERPKYKELLDHPFIVKYRDADVDVGRWYHSVSQHSGDPNKAPPEPAPRKSSLEQRPEPAQSFKPQPSPRLVKSWRAAGHSLPSQDSAETKKPPPQDSSFNRLKYFNEARRDSDHHLPTSPRLTESQRYENTSPRLTESQRYENTSPRLTESQRYENPRLHDLSLSSRFGDSSSGSSRYEPRYNLDSSRLNGSLSRSNLTSSYHGSAAANYLSRPSFINSRSHEEYSQVKSPPQSSRYDKLSSYSETKPSPSSAQRKYSFETQLETSPRDYQFTPKGSRKYDSSLANDQHSPRKFEGRLESPRHEPRDSGQRKYPALPVPEQTRGREPARDTRTTWRIGSWTLSSPLNLRKFRTTSSDRTSTFDRNLRMQPGYRSLNERDKQFQYSSSGKSSDNL